MNTKIKAILIELAKRNKAKAIDWGMTPIQAEVISDQSTYKAIQATRRASKSYTAGISMMKTAIENPNVSILYLSLTRDSCKRIMFVEILQEINDKIKLGATFNKSSLTVEFPNKSRIYLLGIDANEAEARKILGQKYKLIVLDECAFFQTDLKYLIEEILKPAIADQDGKILMISTTSHMLNTYYHKVTMGEIKGWKVWKYDYTSNPYMSDKIQKQIDTEIANNPNVIHTNSFRRNYLNQWVIEDDLKVYKPTPTTFITRDQVPIANNWNYVLGIDLGYNDSTSFVIVKYRPHDRKLYVVNSYSQSKMIMDDVVAEINQLRSTYNFQRMVVDGAALQFVETLRQKYSLPLVSSHKTDKRGMIELINSDFILDNIKIVEDDCSNLKKEMDMLVWNERAVANNKWIEDGKYANHECDGFLYAYRYCYNYLSMLEPKSLTEEDTMLQNIINQFKEEQEDDMF
jgi:hypothetical protein